MQPLRLCTFLVFIVILQASEPSKKVLDLVSYFGGDYDNREQTQEAGDDHDFVQIRLIPVDVKCLRPDPVVFVEEAANGVIRVFTLAVLKDSIEDTVSLKIHNFTDYTKYKPREYNVENLSNFPCGDLEGDEDCLGSFEVSSEGFAFGNFPQCRVTLNEQHPRFTGMHKCDSLTAAMPMYSTHKIPIEPYELKLTSKKYPVINPPEDYVAPCGN